MFVVNNVIQMSVKEASKWSNPGPDQRFVGPVASNFCVFKNVLWSILEFCEAKTSLYITMVVAEWENFEHLQLLDRRKRLFHDRIQRKFVWSIFIL
jgi:hypothetical protein